MQLREYSYSSDDSTYDDSYATYGQEEVGWMLEEEVEVMLDEVVEVMDRSLDGLFESWRMGGTCDAIPEALKESRWNIFMLEERMDVESGRDPSERTGVREIAYDAIEEIQEEEIREDRDGAASEGMNTSSQPARKRLFATASRAKTLLKRRRNVPKSASKSVRFGKTSHGPPNRGSTSLDLCKIPQIEISLSSGRR